MLQQPGVACGERGGREAKDLPEGEIPGHDGQHGSEWLVAHETAGGVGGDRFISEQSLTIFGVVAAGPGAFLRLRDGGGQGLAHFGGHHGRDLVHDVGQVAADMRSLRPPDPYKQKGIRITGERLKKKAGKAGAKAGGA